MKEYCVDLKIAKELKENGFSQDTLYRYEIHNDGYNICPTYIPINDHVNDIILCPTTDEILKELPFEITGNVLEIVRYENGTIEADYKKEEFFGNSKEYLIQDKCLYYKLSNALAKLWLHLKTKGYIK